MWCDRRIDHRNTTTTTDDYTDTFAYDAMERLTTQATTVGASRTLSFGYDSTSYGNLTSKTSSIAGDLNVTGFAYGATGKPHRLTAVTIAGISNTLGYDNNGNIATYDAASGNDTSLTCEGQNNFPTYGHLQQRSVPVILNSRVCARRSTYRCRQRICYAARHPQQADYRQNNEPSHYPLTSQLKKFLKNKLPGPELITENRYLRFLSPWLGHPRLWHMHRRSVALGIAIGLFTGLLPGPIQILLALLISIPLRANVLAAAFATFYTNPFTFIPLYILAYKVGGLVTGEQAGALQVPHIEMSVAGMGTALPDLLLWISSLGNTLLIGLVIQATATAVLGYFLTLIVWRVVVTWRWRNRHRPHRKP